MRVLDTSEKNLSFVSTVQIHLSLIFSSEHQKSASNSKGYKLILSNIHGVVVVIVDNVLCNYLVLRTDQWGDAA